MTAPSSIDPARFLDEQLAQASPDLLRQMLTTFINTLFSTTIKNYADHKRRHQKQVDKTVEIEITKAELEEKFFKGRHTLTLCGLVPSTDSGSPPHRH